MPMFIIIIVIRLDTFKATLMNLTNTDSIFLIILFYCINNILTYQTTGNTKTRLTQKAALKCEIVKHKL